METLTTIMSKIKNFTEEQWKWILATFIAGVLAYFTMMSEGLVNNYDGIWHPSNFIAGDWEISLGRGLQRYADRVRFGIVSDAFNSMITIFLFSIGINIIMKCFDVKRKLLRILASVILIANPIVCDILSYSYMSPNFGLAFVFAVLSFTVLCGETCTKKKIIVNVIVSSMVFAISMAFYQSYISVTALLMLLLCIKKISADESNKQVICYAGKCMGTCVLGGAIYWLITKALLFRAGIELASYRGASGVSLVKILINLPLSLKNAFVSFYDYLFTYKAYSNLEFINLLLILITLFELLVIVSVSLMAAKKHIIKGVICFLLSLFIPVASGFVILIAVGNSMSDLMSYGYIMSLAMIPALIDEDEVPQTVAVRSVTVVRRGVTLILAAFLWFQLSAAVNDQIALKEGKTATVTLVQNIVTTLQQEDCLEDYNNIAFVGRPADNFLFSKSTAYLMANNYARFGCFSTDARNSRVTYDGVLRSFLGVSINLCGDEDYNEIKARDFVASMPQFPLEGSIVNYNGTIVVKVSDCY